jgi:hypothetical protein
MNFVKLTYGTVARPGTTVYINLDHIIGADQVPDSHTTLYASNNETWTVVETLDQIFGKPAPAEPAAKPAAKK